jgi:hypothetical protein
LTSSIATCTQVSFISCPAAASDAAAVVLLLLQRAYELVGRELPVMVAEVVPDQHRIRFNCIAAVAAQRASLQPADLVTGIVTEVRAAVVMPPGTITAECFNDALRLAFCFIRAQHVLFWTDTALPSPWLLHPAGTTCNSL